MNEKARALKLENTHFVTPHGLDKEDHYTTAYELAQMANYALKNQKFAKIVNTKQTSISINGEALNISNTNELLGNLYGVDGVKTGFTNNAGRCIVTSTTREGHQIICVVLGADTKKIRTQDSVKLIEYVFSNFDYINIQCKITEEFEKWKDTYLKQVNIIKGCKNTPNISIEALPYKEIPIEKEKANDIQIQIYANQVIEAPIAKDTQIGTMQVKIGNETIAQLSIKIEEEIKKKNVLDYIEELIQKHLPNLLINSEY